MAGRLKDEGEVVTIISPPDGDGDVRVPFGGGRPFFRAARMGETFDRIVVHFQPSLYYRPRAPVSKIATSLGLLWLVLRRRQTEVLVHEADRPTLWRPDYFLLRIAFARAALLFHTDAERRALERAYRVHVRARLIPHTGGIKATAISREEARRLVGIGDDEVVFLCAGFVHPDKGFERAAEAFARAGSPGRLVIVGSIRDPVPANLSYLNRLRQMASQTPGVALIEDYLSDEEFDAWIAAADRVVLPYRRSWSSGALARCQALGTPAIVTAVGGLAEQAGPRDLVVGNDDELAEALSRSPAAARG
jgi:glycosyltransferase involved in cell wall biosynthesis